MSQRRKIEMTGAENFRISDTNPNEAVGLPGCMACGSWRCPGPFMVFPTRVNVHGTPRMAFVSVSLSCAKKAVLTYERGGELQRIGSGRTDDAPDKRRAVEQAAELLAAVGVPFDAEEVLKDKANPYFQTGIAQGASAMPLNRLLEEARADDDGMPVEPQYNEKTPGFPGQTAVADKA
jgi:hypothetical protein